MSLFAVLHASVVVPGVDATCVTPGRPNFLAEDLGFDPAVTLHLVLDKTAPAVARAALAGAVRAFLGATAGRVVVLYGDVPVVAREAGSTRACRGYADLVAPGGGEVVDAVAIPRVEPAEPVDTLVAWSRAVCAAGGGVAEVVRALDLPGVPTALGDSQASAPPPWAAAATVVRAPADRGVNHVDIVLAEPVARADLDDAFGPGQPLPRIHPGDAHKLAYEVSVAGAAHTCAIFAAFAADPDAEGATAHAVVLRPDRAG